MEPYFFEGIVLPQRAQFSAQFALGFTHVSSGVPGEAKVSIILNQIAAWITTEYDWDIFDLRNVVRTIIQNHLAIFGYLTGLAYDIEIIRVVNPSRNADYVFGIEMPCIAQRNKDMDITAALLALRQKTIGPHGIYLNRCFSDLTSAMKNADDTGFYCYRAIEALRHHCAADGGLSSTDKTAQWEKFRSIAGCDRSTIEVLKNSADPLRHGGVDSKQVDRAKLLTTTWDIVDGYLKQI